MITDAIAQRRKAFGFRLIAYVIMPEHVHLVMAPKQDSKVGEVIGEIKRISARHMHELLVQHSAPLLRRLMVFRNGVERFVFWQRRCFDHNCRSLEALREVVEYCHHNPVKRGLVRDAVEWQWSSCQWYAGHRDVPLELDDPGREE